MPDIAQGSFITVRGEDYQVHKVEVKPNHSRLIYAEGTSELVNGFHFIFDEDLEDQINVNDASQTVLKADNTNEWQKTRLHVETQIRNATVDSGNIVIGHKAAIDPAPYQLDPVIKALDLPRPRILIADGVGLGKTIETGIFLSEMIKRGKGRRILVLALKSILQQFQQEIWSRFSIPLVKLDSQGIARIKAELPANKNPFDYYDKTIISIDTLKNNAKFRHYIEKSHWDVIVIDECHTVANIHTQRGDLAHFLSTRCESLVLTSATPHNGKKESFANLIRMIEPTAIPPDGEFTKEDVEPYYVRRFKTHIEDSVKDSFKERELSNLRTDLNPEEEDFLRFQQQMKNRAKGNQNKRDVLFSVGLLKAYLSSPEACMQTLKNRRGSIEAKEEPKRYEAHLEELDQAIEKLTSIIEAGADSKFNRLLKYFDDQGWCGRRSDDRYIIFAERVDTVRALAEKIRARFGLNEKTVKTFDGGLSDMEQQEIIDDFGKQDSDIRLLISSDAGSQGVNLHYHCNQIINYDIPWSIIRLDQRNGRIDRFGQKKTPYIHYMITDSEEEGVKTDLFIIEKLVEKEDVIHQTLGDARSVMKLYDPDEEEEKVEEAVAESDTGFLDDLENFDFDTIFEQEEEVTSTQGDESAVEEQESLFSGDFAYYELLTRYLQGQKLIGKEELEIERDEQLISLAHTNETDGYLFDIPDEAKPKKRHFFRLTTDDERVQQGIDASRKKKGEWPQFQKLYDLHPLARFWMSKLEAHVDKDVATVVRLPNLPPDTFHFVFQGLVSNNLGQPLLSRFIVTPLDAEGRVNDEIMEMDAFSRRYDLQNFSANTEVTPEDVALAELLLPEAVEYTRDLYINPQQAGLQDKMLKKLEDYEQQLRKWRKEAFKQLELSFGEASSGVRMHQKQKKQENIQDITDSKSRYFQDMCALDNPPHIQLVTVFFNRSV